MISLWQRTCSRRRSISSNNASTSPFKGSSSDSSSMSSSSGSAFQLTPLRYKHIDLCSNLQQHQVESRWTGDRLVHRWTTAPFGDEILLTGDFPFFLVPWHVLL